MKMKKKAFGMGFEIVATVSGQPENLLRKGRENVILLRISNGGNCFVWKKLINLLFMELSSIARGCFLFDDLIIS